MAERVEAMKRLDRVRMELVETARCDAKLSQTALSYLATELYGVSTAVAELIEAGCRVTAAFRAIGNDKAPVARPAQVLECEQAMLALSTALARVGGAA